MVLVAGVLASPVMAGASTPSGGKISLWANANLTGATSKVVVVGAIADHGVGTSIDKNGKVDPNGAYERISLKNGSFEADATALDQNASAGRYRPSTTRRPVPSLSPSRGHSRSRTGRGRTRALGTVTATEQFVGIMPRLKTGKNKGACDQSDSARPVTGAGAVTGTGTIAFNG